MSKKEKPHNNTEIQPLDNCRTLSDFINNDAYMLFPDKDDWRKRFIATLITWAYRDDSLEIVDFALEMKMYRSMLYRWIEKYPDIREAYEQAKLIISSRRRKGALTKKFDRDVVFRDMHVYDPEWLAINKYHSDMKKDEEKQAHTFIISDAKPKVLTKEEMENGNV